MFSGKSKDANGVTLNEHVLASVTAHNAEFPQSADAAVVSTVSSGPPASE
jgi:hypothetical protein